MSFAAVPGTSGPINARSANRNRFAPDYRYSDHGLPCCQDSVMLWHLAVLPFAVLPFSLLPSPRSGVRFCSPFSVLVSNRHAPRRRTANPQLGPAAEVVPR